jgi:hypothetical protein
LLCYRLPANHSKDVSVSVNWKDVTHTHVFPLSATLWDVLQKMDAEHPPPPPSVAAAEASATAASATSDAATSAASAASTSNVAAASSPHWSGWVGVPAPEINSMFEVHITVPGVMAPTLEVAAGGAAIPAKHIGSSGGSSGGSVGTTGRRFIGEADLRATTLANLGVGSETAQPGKLSLRLAHTYQPPHRTEQEKKDIVDNFQRKYAQMMAGGAAAGAGAAVHAGAGKAGHGATSASAKHAAAASSTPMDDSEEEDEEDAEDERASPAVVSIPSDRGLKVLHALPGMLPPPELPDEFYDVTEEDSLLYARALRAEVVKLDRSAALEKNPPTALPLDAAHAHASVAALAHEAHLKRVAHVPHDSAPVPHTDSPTARGAADGGHKEKLLDSSRLPPAPSRSARRKRACRATLLRVRLPNHLYVEGLFRTEETPKELYAWLDSLLVGGSSSNTSSAAASPSAVPAPSSPSSNAADSAPSAATPAVRPDYYLYITPPRQVLSRSSRLTFAQLGLLPLALVHFGLPEQHDQAKGEGAFTVLPDTPEETARKLANPAVGLLRPDIAARVQRIEPPPPPPTKPNPVDEAAKDEEEAEKKEEGEAECGDKGNKDADAPMASADSKQH